MAWAWRTDKNSEWQFVDYVRGLHGQKHPEQNKYEFVLLKPATGGEAVAGDAKTRLDLAKRIETNPLGWLPTVGDVINVTLEPHEAKVLCAVLRSPDVAAEAREPYAPEGADPDRGSVVDLEMSASEQHGPRPDFRLSNHGFKGELA